MLISLYEFVTNCKERLEVTNKILKLSDEISILRDKEIPNTIIEVFRQLNIGTNAHISINQRLRGKIQIPAGEWQGHSLTPELFKIIVD